MWHTFFMNNANNIKRDWNSGMYAVESNKKELEHAALNLAHYLYWLWIEQRKCEIIKMDKTIYDNEEPANTN